MKMKKMKKKILLFITNQMQQDSSEVSSYLEGKSNGVSTFKPSTVLRL